MYSFIGLVNQDLFMFCKDAWLARQHNLGFETDLDRLLRHLFYERKHISTEIEEWGSFITFHGFVHSRGGYAPIVVEAIEAIIYGLREDFFLTEIVANKQQILAHLASAKACWQTEPTIVEKIDDLISLLTCTTSPTHART